MSRRGFFSILLLGFANVLIWTLVSVMHTELRTENDRIEEQAQLASPEIRTPFQEPITASADVGDTLIRRK